MSNEWIELKDLQAVAKAQADGWEIVEAMDEGLDAEWDGGYVPGVTYRGRPKAKMREVVLRVPVFKDGEGVWTGYASTEYEKTNCTSECFVGYLDEIPHRWEGGKLILEVKE